MQGLKLCRFGKACKRNLINPNKAGLLEDSFFWEGQFDLPPPPPLHSYFKKNLTNVNFMQLLNNLFKVC